VYRFVRAKIMKRYILFFLVVVGFLCEAQSSKFFTCVSADAYYVTASKSFTADLVARDSECAVSMGTNDEVTSKIKIFPDPATGIVRIDFGGEIVKILSIMDAQRQEVFRQVVGGANSLNLNLKFLKKGIYFIVFDDSIGANMKQLIVD
jgi:hypothetical protein